MRPGLATKWTQPDERTYVFTLRRGVTFTDGTPLTPDDVVASVEAIRDPKNTRARPSLRRRHRGQGHRLPGGHRPTEEARRALPPDGRTQRPARLRP
ncbi:ABC transporter substrate-binding protein [Streptomyces sp. NEAU-PBA10]|uniref:ABC transporter substrate-binding protein n=1 Tax=Streptomyces TaxID=1883 RepID=UPI001E506F08|nr:ABC transporter substrate-binding protein [Streptomyces sp. BSP1]MCQ9707879.1 ABC transporter substrate-binding protein [Streptomyces sp. BSP1]